MKKQKVYIGEGAEYDGWIFVRMEYRLFSINDNRISMIYSFYDSLGNTKLIPIGTL